MKTKTVFALLLLQLFVGCAVVSQPSNSENYEVKLDRVSGKFVVDAEINDLPVTLALDTATEGNVVLFSPAAERIGLPLPATPSTNNDTRGKTAIHKTEPQAVTLFNTSNNVPLYVARIPLAAPTDGTVGWGLLEHRILQIDVADRSVRLLETIPAEVLQWTKLPLSRDANVLALEIPSWRGNDTLVIDTGNAGGVSLSPEQWQKWTKANPDRPKTLQISYISGSGVVAGEEDWARQLSLGPLSLPNVPVREASITEQRAAPNCAATLGLVALERLDLIVDGKAGVAYVRPRQGPFRPYSYNRAALVFIPTDLTNGIHSESKAVVLEDGPAYQAGIRDGDMPLKVGDQWRTNWVKTPTYLASELPAGSKMELTLQRGETNFTAEVILQDIFPPAASGATQ
jgi:hypothetical protein